MLFLLCMMQSLPAQRLDGTFRVTCFGTACQVGYDVVRHGQRHSAIVDFDDEGFAGFLLIDVKRARRARHGCRLPSLGRCGFFVEVLAFQPFGADIVCNTVFGGEFVVIEDLFEQACRSWHAFHFQFAQCSAYTCHGRGAVGCGDHEFAHHRIEFRRDGVAFDHAGIHADARSGRPTQRSQRAGAWRKVLCRIFAGQTQFETVSTKRMVHGQFPTVGDGQLFAHQVESADLLADGMLHLQARIDFQEVHFALFGHHEFAGAKAFVIDRFEQSAGVGFQLVGHIGGKERCGSLFNKLLIAALHGAVARGIHGEVAMRVASALRFDVTPLVDEPFHEVLVQIAALQSVMIHVEATQLIIIMHQRDATAATAIGALEHQRITVRMREIKQQSHVGNRLGNTGNRRNFRKRRHTTCGDLISQIHEGFRIGTNPSRARVNHFLCK